MEITKKIEILMKLQEALTYIASPDILGISSGRATERIYEVMRIIEKEFDVKEDKHED